MIVLRSYTTIVRSTERFSANWRDGKRFGIPWCCRMHFCCDRALGRVVSVVRWREIGTWETPIQHEHPWVPCGICHAGYSPWRLPSRMMRVVAFNLALLLPGCHAGWLRERCTSPGPVWVTLEVSTKVSASRDGLNGQMWWAHRARRLEPVSGYSRA